MQLSILLSAGSRVTFPARYRKPLFDRATFVCKYNLALRACHVLAHFTTIELFCVLYSMIVIEKVCTSGRSLGSTGVCI